MISEQITRYARHLVLKEVGGPGQTALLASRIAIVGAGGLGGPAGLYLAAAGVGNLTLVDNDTVELSNLQRQIQFSSDDIDTPKVNAMGEHLSAMNSDAQVTAHRTHLTSENSEELLAGHDLILDGTDNFETRFEVNKAAMSLGIPLVSGAIGRFDGQVSLFPSDGKGPCYQCLVSAAPPGAQTCSEVGVVGALAGIIGSMMALEAIKHITGAGETLSGRLWIFDGLRSESRTVRLSKDVGCPACGMA